MNTYTPPEVWDYQSIKEPKRWHIWRSKITAQGQRMRRTCLLDFRLISCIL